MTTAVPSNIAKKARARGSLVLIFDLDGTLIDCMALHASAFASLLSDNFSISRSDALAEYYRTAGASLADQIRSAVPTSLPLTSSDIERISRRFIEVVRSSQPTPFEEVIEVIRCLKRARYHLAVSSGGPPDLVHYKLMASNLDQYFSIKLGTDGDRSGMAKGAGHFKLIRDHFCLSVDQFKAQAVMIGDTMHDMEVAKRGGLLAIGRSGWVEAQDLLDAGANIVVSSLLELLELFGVKCE